MAMSRSRSAIQTWVATLAYVAATMITGFVVTPYILGQIGEVRYGVVRTLIEGSGYLTLVAQGGTVAMIPLIAAAIGSGDRAGLHRILAVGFRMYFFTSLTFILLGLALLPVLGRVFHVAAEGRPELRIAWLLCLAGLPLVALSPMKVLIDVANKGFVSNILATMQGLLAAALSVVLVWAGIGVVGLMLALLISSAAFSLSTTIVALRMNPGLIGETVAARPTSSDWKNMVSLAGPTLVAMLGERIGVLSDSIVLTIVIGGAAVTKLVLTQRLASLGQMILNGISGAVWPSLAEMHNRGERHAFNVRLVEVTRLITVLGVSGLAPVIAYNPHFVAMWVGSSNDGGRLVVLAASALAISQGLIYTYSAILVSTGYVGWLAKAAILSSLLNLGVSVVLSYYLGVIGPILGSLVAAASVQLWYVPMRLREAFGTSLRKLFFAALVPILWGIPFTLGLIALADAHTPTNWFALLGEMAVSAILALVFAFTVILGPGDRDLWRARLITPLMKVISRSRA